MTLQSFDDTTLLIGLGAARTGTRWLSNYFTKHADVLMSPIRVLHYFDAQYEPDQYGRFHEHFDERLSRIDLRKHERRVKRQTDIAAHEPEPLSALRDRVRMREGDAAYIDYFRRRWSGQAVICDITPSYAFLGAGTFAAMFRIHPRVKFLFMMRNPIDRFWSTFTKQRTADPDFDPYADFDEKVRGKFSKDYQHTVAGLEATVPPEAVKYMFFEEFFNERSIADLTAFLGVSAAAAEFEVRLNRSESFPLDQERRAIAYKAFEPVYRFVYERYGGRIPQNWLADMERFSCEPASTVA